MVLAHLAAAAGVGLWLVLGERALWRALALAAEGVRLRLRGAGLRLVVPARGDLLVRGSAVPDGSVHRARQQALLRRSLSRRGPPVPLLGPTRST